LDDHLEKKDSLLNEEQVLEVKAFEQSLYDLSLDQDKFPAANVYKAEKDNSTEKLKSLEDIWNLSVNSSGFGINYFTTQDGKEAFRIATGVTINKDASHEEVASLIAGLNTAEIDSKVLDTLSGTSIGFEEDKITKAFIDNGYKGSGVPAPEITVLFKNPEVIEQKAQGYRQLKAYIVSAIRDLKDNPETSSAIDAQIAVAELYRRRINHFLLNTYAEAYKLLAQNRKSGNNIYEDSLDNLEQILPAFNQEFGDDTIARFMQRIDRMQQGASLDADEKFTFLSPEAKALAAEAGTNIEDTATPIDRGKYTPIDPEILNSTEINGDTFGDWIKEIMTSYELLSTSEEWSSEREGPAEDGKWQVIVNDKFKALSVIDKQRILKVPKGKVYTVIEALSLISHEVVHAIQHQNKRAISDMAILQRIGLDNPSEQTESGGKWQEKVARETLTGEVDTDIPGTSYLKALEVRALGGSYGDSLEAFFEDFKRRNPDMNLDRVALQSVNRTRRIFRGGGLEYAQNTNYVTDSQPLNYLEQNLIYENLSEKQRNMLYLGGIAIKNFNRLAEFGLVDKTEIKIPSQKPIDILFPTVRELIDKK
jgi:hypothetical protein